MLAAPCSESVHDLTTCEAHPKTRQNAREQGKRVIFVLDLGPTKKFREAKEERKINVKTSLPSISTAFMPFKTILALLLCEFLLKDEDPTRNAEKGLPFMELAIPLRLAPGSRLLTDKALADATFVDARKAAARGTRKPLLIGMHKGRGLLSFVKPLKMKNRSQAYVLWPVWVAKS